MQFNLKQIGLNVNSHLFARAVQIDKEGTRGEPFDITSEGWIADYADPYDFINVLLSGDSLHASNNNNVAYFNDPTYNKQMRSAALLSGQARYTSYGNLDVSMMARTRRGRPATTSTTGSCFPAAWAASPTTRPTASTWRPSASSRELTGRPKVDEKKNRAPFRGRPFRIQIERLNTLSTNHRLKSRSVLRHPIRRLMWACVLFVAVTIVTYVIFYAIPANPARLACGQRATPECIKRAAHYLGTDRPLYVQYGKFFGRRCRSPASSRARRTSRRRASAAR